MLENNPATLEQSIVCHLCAGVFSASQAGMRGRLNFCQACAYQRPAECLARLNGDRKGSRGVAVAVAIFGVGIIAGVAWWALKTLQHGDALPFKAPVSAPVAAQPAPKPGPPREPPAHAAPETAVAEEKTTPWIQRIFNDQRQRSVADAGHIHLLFVTRPGTDACMGLSSRLFITREAPDKDCAKLVTEVGSHMATSFEEGLRYVRKLPRGWERDFSIRLSFEDKFTAKDGGSAGTGFTIAMLAAIQEIALDPGVAVTGDLTVDGTVQPVGAVVEKLRGAIAGKCKITLIPERNSRDVADLALIDGTSPLWETQVFSIGTIDQALAHARRDRAGNAADAIARFTALRARLPEAVTPNYLASPIVQTELKEVLRLAPNHLSAATLLGASALQLPGELSLNRSVGEILGASHLFVSDVIEPKEKSPKTPENPGITVFPEREFGECVKKLQRLTPIVDRRSLELKSACMTYAGALRAVWTYQAGDASGARSHQQWAELARRERNFQQQARDDLNDAKSRLLLALRKLDTDGSLVSEMTKK